MMLGLEAADLVLIVAFDIIMMFCMAFIEKIFGPMMAMVAFVIGIGLFFYQQNKVNNQLEEEIDFLHSYIEDLETQNADLKNHQVPFAA